MHHGVHFVSGEGGPFGGIVREVADEVSPPLAGVPSGPDRAIAAEEDAVYTEAVDDPTQHEAKAAVVGCGLVLKGGEVGDEVGPVPGYHDQLAPRSYAHVCCHDFEVREVGQDLHQLLRLAEPGVQGLEHLAGVEEDGKAEGLETFVDGVCGLVPRVQAAHVGVKLEPPGVPLFDGAFDEFQGARGPGVYAGEEDVAVGVCVADLGELPVLVFDGLGGHAQGAGPVDGGVDGQVYACLVHLGDAVRAVGVEALGEEVAVDLLGGAGEGGVGDVGGEEIGVDIPPVVGEVFSGPDVVVDVYGHDMTPLGKVPVDSTYHRNLGV